MQTVISLITLIVAGWIASVILQRLYKRQSIKNPNNTIGVLNYSEAKRRMIDALLSSAVAHESGRLKDIEKGYDDLDRTIPRGGGLEFAKIGIALSFWDGWIDSRNHNWKYYSGISQRDWPRLARKIADDLIADRDIEDDAVLKHFGFT